MTLLIRYRWTGSAWEDLANTSAPGNMPQFDDVTMTGNVGASGALTPDGSHGPSGNGTIGNPLIIEDKEFTSYLDFTGAQYVTYRNCRFENNGASSGACVAAFNCTGLRFENCTFAPLIFTAIDGFNGYGASPSAPIVFEDCAFVNVSDGLKLNANMQILHCYIRPAVGYGASIHGDGVQATITSPSDSPADNLVIQNSYIEGGSNDAIFLQNTIGSNDSTNLLIDNNWLISRDRNSEHTSFLLHITPNFVNVQFTNNKLDITHADGYYFVDDAGVFAAGNAGWSNNIDYISSAVIPRPT